MGHREIESDSAELMLSGSLAWKPSREQYTDFGLNRVSSNTGACNDTVARTHGGTSYIDD